MPTPATLLVEWIVRRGSHDALAWFEDTRANLSRDLSPRAFAAAFGSASRRVGKTDLMLQQADLVAAETARRNWRPAGMTIDQAARIVLLLDAAETAEGFVDRLKHLAGTADLGELAAIYKGLPLYPHPQTLVPFAIDGLRTAMAPVFEAVAQDNPFPSDHFSQDAWNNMVLKALFIGSALHPIIGLDRRWNAELADMLVAYAHERRAARRPIPPELWRGVGRFADASTIDDLAALLVDGDALSQKASALALSESPDEAAARALASRRDLAEAVALGEIEWSDVYQRTPY